MSSCVTSFFSRAVFLVWPCSGPSQGPGEAGVSAVGGSRRTIRRCDANSDRAESDFC